MSSIGSPSPFFLAGKKKAHEIERSARFRGATDQRFDRTLSSTSSSYTVSMWFKTVPVTTNFARGLFTLGPANNTDVAGVVFNTNDTLTFYGGNGTSSIVTTRKLRDTSAWYYFTYSVNSNNFTAYINGESLQTGTVRSLDTTSNGFRLGGWWGGYDLFRGYIADFYLIDGSALTPSSFTETNVETGQLIPKKYTGSFGTSGAHLLFDDNSGTTATTLGKDSSGNSNNFTPNNFVTGDSVQDSPTNNFPTWNPLSTKDLPTLLDGNLKNYGDNNKACNATFGVTSGKWYWEMHILTDVSTTGYIAATGVTGYEMVNDGDVSPRLNYDTSKYSFYRVATSGGYISYKKYTDTNATEISSGGTFYGGTVISFRLDMDNGSLKYYTNNTLVHTDSTIPTDGTVIFPMQNATNSGVSRHNASIVNFGQDGTFAGNKTAQGNTDGDGVGNFFYAVPSGFKALCSANLPDPAILLPNKHFDPVTYTGSGSGTQSITSLNFQPDWVWLKIRSDGGWHALIDSVRGVGKILASNESDAENNSSDSQTAFSAFLSNGFTVGYNTSWYVNGTSSGSSTQVAWNWNAGDTDGKTYTVKVHNFSGNNRYIFDDFQTQAVTLDLAEGGTYIFNMDDASNASHPFSIGTAANGTVYTSGITYFLDGVSKTYSEYTSGFAAATTRRLHITVPASAPVLYYWCSAHSGMGGQVNTNSTLGSSNFDGTTQSVAKVNASAGFSIVTYTGTGSNTNIGHGLGVTPQVVITKARSATSGWAVLHTVGDPNAEYRLVLNDNGGYSSYQGGNLWNDTVPTSTHFRVSSDASTNASGVTYVGYVFSEVSSFSKFGKYTGNGSSDGPFVYLGFKPAFIIIKRTNASEGWHLFDNKRDPDNPIEDRLEADLSGAAFTGYDWLDILSNGFKTRVGVANTNASGSTYIYLAFAESPFKNARAR